MTISTTQPASCYPLFDRSRLTLLPLQARESDLTIDVLLPLHPVQGQIAEPLIQTARQIKNARQDNRAVVLLMGAHVLRDGVQRYLIDLLEHDYISCIAVNGAGIIHDYELALTGSTTESVARYISSGQFGLWKETGILNDIVRDAAQKNMGLGEGVGRAIEKNNLPFRDRSLLAAGWRLGIPITVHVGIGYDIVHEHPNCDGGSWGKCSYTDFLIFTKVLEAINQGVVMNFGTAVMGPEIFLKALAMVRNVAKTPLDTFTSLVCDLKPLPDHYHQEADRLDPSYYFRPWKTLLVRTLSGTGQSYYLQARHRHSIPALWTALVAAKKDLGEKP